MRWVYAALRSHVLPAVATSALIGITSSMGMFLASATGCPDNVFQYLKEGETFLLRGDAMSAYRIAEDALLEARNCDCAYELRARANFVLMQEALHENRAADAESARKQCLSDAFEAESLFRHPPRLKALQDLCRA